MIDHADLWVEVRDQDIVVTMPGTSLRVVYRKRQRGSQLVPRLDYFQDRQKGPITRTEFLARPEPGTRGSTCTKRRCDLTGNGNGASLSGRSDPGMDEADLSLVI